MIADKVRPFYAAKHVELPGYRPGRWTLSYFNSEADARAWDPAGEVMLTSPGVPIWRCAVLETP